MYLARDHHAAQDQGVASLSNHAWRRMNARRLSADDVVMVMAYGRVVYVRGAAIHTIGRQEVRRYARQGVDLADHEGIQVVCSPDGVIMTVYRNRDLSRLRPQGGRRRMHSHP